MPVPIRILRAQADDLPGARPRVSARELETQDRILATATSLMATHGRTGLTMASFAAAMRLSPATIRRHFPDLDSILFEILHRHLHAIAVSFGAIGFDAPNRSAARRAAYVAHTRTPFSAPTEQHLLLLRERHALSPDLAEPVAKLRVLIGDMLCPAHPEIALALLDTPELQPAQIEAMLTALAPTAITLAGAKATAPEPAEPRAPPTTGFKPTLVPPAARAPAGPSKDERTHDPPLINHVIARPLGRSNPGATRQMPIP